MMIPRMIHRWIVKEVCVCDNQTEKIIHNGVRMYVLQTYCFKVTVKDSHFANIFFSCHIIWVTSNEMGYGEFIICDKD